MKNFKIIVSLVLAAMTSMAVAQAPTMDEMEMLDKLRAEYAAKGVQVTPEQEVRMLQRIRLLKGVATAGPTGLAAQMQQLQQQGLQTQAPAANPVATVAPISEADARKQLEALPAGKQFASFELLRDGLKFNGQRFADPEGRAESFALDPQSATAAYVVQTGALTNVKIARIGSGSEPVTIGRLSKNGSTQVFQSSTGKTLSGELFFPMTDGALLVRDSVGFRYVVGEGVKQLDFPSGWSPAPLQRGNISTTGWLLLERDTNEEKGDILSLAKFLGEKTGALPARMDYALFNLADQRLVPFEITTAGKGVTTYSQCRRKNAFANVCDQMKTFDSVWSPNGTPNLTHYYWLIDWQQTQGKPVAVALEKSLQQVNGYDLSGTKRVNLFERMLGINNYRMELADNGKYRVKAQLAFETGIVEDVALEVQNRPDVPR